MVGRVAAVAQVPEVHFQLATQRLHTRSHFLALLTWADYHLVIVPFHHSRAPQHTPNFMHGLRGQRRASSPVSLCVTFLPSLRPLLFRAQSKIIRPIFLRPCSFSAELTGSLMSFRGSLAASPSVSPPPPEDQLYARAHQAGRLSAVKTLTRQNAAVERPTIVVVPAVTVCAALPRHLFVTWLRERSCVTVCPRALAPVLAKSALRLPCICTLFSDLV